MTHEIQFHCIKLCGSHERALSFHELSDKRILSVKGFASRLDRAMKIQEEFLELSSNYDALAFDGDDLNEDSFTKMIAIVAHERAALSVDNSLTSFCLLAVKYYDEISQFLSSWDKKLLQIKDGIMHIRDGSIDSFIGDSGEAPRRVSITVYYTTFPESPDHPKHSCSGSAYYRHLGQKGLEFTLVDDIALFGGGECVREEFEYAMLLPRVTRWHLFLPTCRPSKHPNEEEVEHCQLLDAVESGNCRLIKYFKF